MAIDNGEVAGPDGETRLYEVLAAYFDALEAGQAPDRAEWLSRYPDLAGELVAFLEEEDRLLRATEPFRSSVNGSRRRREPRRERRRYVRAGAERQRDCS